MQYWYIRALEEDMSMYASYSAGLQSNSPVRFAVLVVAQFGGAQRLIAVVIAIACLDFLKFDFAVRQRGAFNVGDSSPPCQRVER